MRCLNCGEPLWNPTTEKRGFCSVSCEKEYKEDNKEIKPSTMPMWSKKSPAGCYNGVVAPKKREFFCNCGYLEGDRGECVCEDRDMEKVKGR